MACASREACRLKLDQVDTESRVLHVARLKHGLSTTQPLWGDELRAVSALRGFAGAVIAGEATARVVIKVIAEFKAVEAGSRPPGIGGRPGRRTGRIGFPGENLGMLLGERGTGGGEPPAMLN